MFQSLGSGKRFDRLAMVIAILIFVGYISIPAAVLIGLVK
jgi:hypothetical protein